MATPVTDVGNGDGGRKSGTVIISPRIVEEVRRAA